MSDFLWLSRRFAFIILKDRAIYSRPVSPGQLDSRSRPRLLEKYFAQEASKLEMKFGQIHVRRMTSDMARRL
jgi:hypothetical protein